MRLALLCQTVVKLGQKFWRGFLFFLLLLLLLMLLSQGKVDSQYLTRTSMLPQQELRSFCLIC